MTVLSALDLPESRIRVTLGTCVECGKERPFGIDADHPLMEGEISMDIVHFLDTMLIHCEENHFGLTPVQVEARRAERQGRPN